MSGTLAHCDTLIKGARVIDPSTGTDAVMDIALAYGLIAAIGPDIRTAAKETFDAAGKVAIPGIIDLHAHPYPEAHWGVEPDVAGVLSGVTTVFDGGSAGVMTFPRFLETYIKKADTDIFAFLHMNPAGEFVLPEVWDRDKVPVKPAAIVETIKNNRQYIKGVKNRAIGSLIRHWGLEAVDMALGVCNECDVPFMMHIGLDPGDETPEEEVTAFTRYLLDKLRPGDIITHAFTGKKGRIFREDGLFDDQVRKAVARGVILDACVGRTNIAWEPLRIAKARGFSPRALGTDLTTFGMESALKSMAVTMSKIVAAGFALHDVVKWVTTAPAVIMGMPERGTLAAGTSADISILTVASGEYEYLDRTGGEKIRGDILITPDCVFKNGRYIRAEKRDGATY